VTENAPIPGGLARVTALGAGCGTPPPVLAANGQPTIPNATFGFTVNAHAGAPVVVYASLGSGNTVVAPGCTAWVTSQFVSHGSWVADGNGLVTAPLPIPNSLALEGTVIGWQAAEIVLGGPLFGFVALSNGVEILIAAR